MDRTWFKVITITSQIPFFFQLTPFYYLHPQQLFSRFTLLEEKCNFQWYSVDNHERTSWLACGRYQQRNASVGYLCLHVLLAISHTHKQVNISNIDKLTGEVTLQVLDQIIEKLEV